MIQGSLTIDVGSQAVTVVGEARNDSDATVGLLRLDVAGAGLVGGIRAGTTADVEVGFWVDPAVFDSATLETRLNGFLVGEPSHRYGVVGIAHRSGLGRIDDQAGGAIRIIRWADQYDDPQPH